MHHSCIFPLSLGLCTLTTRGEPLTQIFGSRIEPISRIWSIVFAIEYCFSGSSSVRCSAGHFNTFSGQQGLDGKMCCMFLFCIVSFLYLCVVCVSFFFF